MIKEDLSFQLPRLEEFIELNPLTVSGETLVIDAIAQMNRPRKSDIACELGEDQRQHSYILVVETTDSPSLSPSKESHQNEERTSNFCSKLSGVLTEQDIVKLSAASVDLTKTKVKEIMTKGVIALKRNDFKDIYQIMSILREHQIRHLPLVDDCGQVEGMISVDGICRTLNPANLLKLRSVAETMNRNVLQAPSSASILTLSQLMSAKRQSAVVIVGNKFSQAETKSLNHSDEDSLCDPISNMPIGIVTERDIMQFQLLGLNLAETTAHTVMSSPLICMQPKDSLQDVQQQMNQLRVRRLVVSGEFGELQGIITARDMLKVFDTTELFSVINTLQQELRQRTKDLQAEIEQRQQSEVKLRSKQQQLEIFVRHAPAAIAMVDQEMRYLAVSDRWIKDYQIKTKNIIGRGYYEIFPETSQQWRQNHQDCLTGKVKSLKSKADSFIRFDGEVALQSWEIYPWDNLAGQIGGLLMFSEMLTETTLLKRRLQSSEAQMRAIFEAMNDLVLTVDVTNDSIQILPTKSVHCNNPHSYNRIIEQTYSQLFDGDQANYYQGLIRQVLQTSQTIDFEYSLKLNDSTVWFNVNISSVSEHVVIWVARNITQRKRMEQKLFAEKELAQVTLKSIGDAVITTDALGKVRYVNPVAERLIGWQAEAAKGKKLTEIFHIINQSTRQPVANPIDVAIQENRVCELANDTLLLSKDGNEYAIEDSAAPILNRQGELVGAVIVFHDVTEARNLTQKLSWQATHDSLTGLYNRRQFEKYVDTAIKNSQDSDSNHALCYLDLDQFKIINDTCGHAAGDELLCQVTQLLQKRIRTLDIFARLGGDEFGLLLHQCSTEMAKEIANQLRELIQDFRFIWDNQVFSIGVSIGIVAVDSNTINRVKVLNRADKACYIAKRKGRNRIYFCHKSSAKMSEISGQRGASK